MWSSISVREAFKYFWNGEKKWTRLFTWLGVVLIFLAISWALSIIQLPFQDVLAVSLSISLISLGFNFLQEVFLNGYKMEVFDISRKGKKLIPKVVEGIEIKLFEGFKLFVIGLFYSIPLLVSFVIYFFSVGLFSYIASIFKYSQNIRTTLGGPISTIDALPNLDINPLVIVFGGLIIFSIILVTSFFINAAVYRYLNKRKLSDAFQILSVAVTVGRGFLYNVLLIVKLVLLSLLLVILVMPFILVLSAFSLLGVFGIILFACGLILLMIPLLMLGIVLSTFVTPHMIGQMYRAWDEKGLDKI